MNKNYFQILLALVSLLTCSCSISSKQLVKLKSPAPNTIFYPIDQGPRALSSELGNIVVLAFWDSDCFHCRRELPILDAFAESLKNNKEVKFIAISVDRSAEENSYKSSIQDLGLAHIEHAFSGNDIFDEAFNAFKGESLPYFVLIDKAGLVLWLGNDAEEAKNATSELLDL